MPRRILCSDHVAIGCTPTPVERDRTLLDIDTPPAQHHCNRVRDDETTILIKFAVWTGLGRGNFTENYPKTLFFLGSSMTIKFGNFTDFIVRNCVVIWEAPIEGAATFKCLNCDGVLSQREGARAWLLRLRQRSFKITANKQWKVPLSCT